MQNIDKKNNAQEVEVDPVILRMQRQERAEREPLQKHIQFATEEFNAHLSEPFEEAKRAVQAKKVKLEAMKAKLQELPKELDSIKKEKAQTMAAIEEAIENGADLSELTKALEGIAARQRELEVMNTALASKIVPRATEELKDAEEGLKEVVVFYVGGILDAKLKATLEAVDEINAELKGWCYAVNDVCDKLKMPLHGQLSHLQFRIGQF